MRARRSTSPGVTLVGLLIAMALGLLVVAAGMRMFIAYQKGYGKLKSMTVVLQDARLVADQFGRELRMAGFGADAGQAILDARADRITFLGDVEDDVRLPLARAAAAGDTVLYVDLDDAEPRVDATDRVFLDGGARETVRVRPGGAVDLGPEPDVIHLDAPLAYAHPAGTTSVHTVEEVTYEFFPDRRMLARNGVVVSDEVDSLRFGYADLRGAALDPGRDGALDGYERASIATFSADIRFAGEGTGGRAAASQPLAVAVDLRNQGFQHYRNDHCPPEAPTGATVLNDRTCRHFQVRWSPPTRNACDHSALDDLAGYRIYFGTSPGRYLLPPYTVNDPAAFEAWVQDSRLELGGTYYVAVAAYDTSFNEGAKSAETRFTLNDTEGPAAPTGIATEAGTDTITLRWTKSPARDAVGYRLYRGTTAAFVPGPETLVADETTLPVETVQYADSGREPCTEYFYVLSAVDCAREGTRSSVVQGDAGGPATDWPDAGRTTTTTIEASPSPPGPVAPFSVSPANGEITVNWVNPADDDYARTIIRFGTGGFPALPSSGTLLVDSAGERGGTGSFVHAGLINGVRYYYSAFAVDRCGTPSAVAHADATPGTNWPMVRLTDPFPGQTVTNGQLRVQAQAYDPDERNISTPPNWVADNGKGITRVVFRVSPEPASGFPATDSTPQYCGFGGNANPCATGNVGQWCEGRYYVYAEATDNENASATTPYNRIYVDSGGLGLDPSYAPNVYETYRNKIRFQVTNDAAYVVSPKTLRVAWNVAAARLVRVNAGSTTLYNADPAPVASGTQFALPANFSIGTAGTALIKLTFSNPYTKTSASVSRGATAIPVYSAAGFAVGDRVYLGDSASRYGTIRSISGNTLTLASGISSSLSRNAYVSKFAPFDNVNMAAAAIDAEFTYGLGPGGPTCPAAIHVDLTGAAVGGEVLQDQPAVDTVPSETAGEIQVSNGAPVPIHVAVEGVDLGSIRSVAAYHAQTAASVETAPASGYASLAMGYDSGDARHEATLPARSNARAWYYVVVTDTANATYRFPDEGAFSYDLVNGVNLSCPTGLVATKVSNNTANLRWDVSGDAYVTGYNVYRRRTCDPFARVASGVTDQDPNAAGVQYVDSNSPLTLNNFCFTWYVTAVDYLGNESAGCAAFPATAGDRCPVSCP